MPVILKHADLVANLQDWLLYHKPKELLQLLQLLLLLLLGHTQLVQHLMERTNDVLHCLAGSCCICPAARTTMSICPSLCCRLCMLCSRESRR